MENENKKESILEVQKRVGDESLAEFAASFGEKLKMHKKSSSEDVSDESAEFEHIGFQEIDQKNAEIFEAEIVPKKELEIAISSPEVLEAQSLVAKLQKEVEDARKEYLEIDYNKNTALKRVRKYFSSESIFKKNLEDNAGKNPDAGFGVDSSRYSDEQKKTFESDGDIAAYRAYYDNKLMKLRDAQIAEARLRGANDAELSDIYGSFLLEQELKVLEMHDDVKAEHHEGKVFGFVREGMLEFSKDYRSWSFKKKIAVGGAFALLSYAGTAAVAAGAASAGAVAGSMIIRRLIMSSLAGIGTAEGLAAKNKNKKEEMIEASKREFQEEIAGMSEEEKFKLLSEQTWNIAIKDEKKTINEIKNKNLGHLAAGTALGVFLGSGLAGYTLRIAGGYVSDSWVGKLTSGAYHKVSDFFDDNHEASSEKKVEAKVNEAKNGKEFKSSDSPIKAEDLNKNDFNLPIDPKTLNKEDFPSLFPNTNALEHPNLPSTANGLMENPPKQVGDIKDLATKAAEAKTGDIPLRIDKGSSIERTLIDHIKKIHPEMSGKAGDMAHRMWLDYMDDNKDSIIAKVGSEEYGKMLKDGMVNVKPGTVLMIDEHDPLKFKIDSIDGKISHLGGHHVATPEVRVDIAPSGEIPADVSPTTDQVYNEWNKEIVADKAAEIAVESDRYSIASAVTNGELPALDPNSPNFESNLGYAKTLSEASRSELYNWAPAYEMGRIGDLIKNSHEHMQALLSMPDKETFTKIGKDFFDGKTRNIVKFGGLNVREALNDPENNLKGLSTKAKKLIIGYASAEETRPKAGENFKLWSYRIMTLARRPVTSNNGNLDNFDPTGL